MHWFRLWWQLVKKNFTKQKTFTPRHVIYHLFPKFINPEWLKEIDNLLKEGWRLCTADAKKIDKICSLHVTLKGEKTLLYNLGYTDFHWYFIIDEMKSSGMERLVWVYGNIK